MRYPAIAIAAVALSGCAGAGNPELGNASVQRLSRPDVVTLPDEERRRTVRYHGFRRIEEKVYARQEVTVSCMPYQLRNLMREIAAHYDEPMMINSGFRSKSYNRRVGGARHSFHLQCKAVDFSIPGVSARMLARYVRSLPGRGGVGTYCGRSFIHLDVGSERDWNWSCPKRRRRHAKLRGRVK